MNLLSWEQVNFLGSCVPVKGLGEINEYVHIFEVLVSDEIEKCILALNSGNSFIGLCKRSQHCWAQHVASVCTPCCVLLRVVATCWKLLDEV